ncbi:hypothetical protein NLJ89_g6695 [Agrocybe chaxingu]|uniref:DUF6589 domain-containing protein n=1 Tax=Agrocybe chaxingu TaxID=84603 RepID=A0A9W8MW58_9AGAR|nr:hypothetical protein NLJ89_g6695 [Agrocybe chaxingu]
MTATMQHFFNGHKEHTPSKILENWMKHPYGRLQRNSNDNFSTVVPYTKLKPVCPALTSFAAQLVANKLIEEAEKAIDAANGLHLSLTGAQKRSKKLEWTDIGSLTFETVQNILQEHQPLTWSLVMKIATRPPRNRNGAVAVRIKRPVNLVAASVISILDFSRSSRAKLLPLASAVLDFGGGASFDSFRYRSRIGHQPSYSSTVRAMNALADHEAANYLPQRDPSIGRENKLNIGIAATYYEIELEGVDIQAFNLENTQKMQAEGQQERITVDKLLGLVDHEHLANICILQWINTLVQHIPHLAHLQPEISLRYRTRAAKQPLKAKPAKVHPLASSGKNETIMTELKEALGDFLEQSGQTAESFKKRLFPIGGDGLTYEKILQLTEYLQFHTNDVDAMRIVKPLLEWWHTEWTNLSRLFEAHWGMPLSQDPSTLGHSATKIGYKKPPNLKKVDFYTSRDLAFLVLDARMLDCWRIFYRQDNLFQHFDRLASQKRLPSFEDLELAAKQLYKSYTSLRAQERALRGPHTIQNSTVIPKVSPWPSPTREGKDSSQALPLFLGDNVLSRSISFMRDTMFAREFSEATAEGDVGRIWEIIKVMVFTFAGSTHGKYTQYVLEMIADLEYDCSPEVRRGLLQMTLVNLSGREGHWSAGDFIQEYFNRLLEAAVERKGVDYGDKFIRKIWSRNIHHIARLKISWMDGVGLKTRSSKHTGAKRDAELRILLDVYKATDVHAFCAGRTIDSLETFEDDFQKGVKKLRGGKLKKWLDKTIRSRNLWNLSSAADVASPSQVDSSKNGDEDSDSDDDEDGAIPCAGIREQQLRFSVFVDGSLVEEDIDTEEVRTSVHDLMGYENDSEDSGDEIENGKTV